MPTETLVACPGCGRTQPKTHAGLYWCAACRCQFDDDPDEGGSHWNDPAKRLEKTEERENRRRRR